MAFYDASAESQKSLTPLQQALVLPPDVILHHQDLLTSIAKTANFSDEKAEYILDNLLKNIQESLSYNNPTNSRTSLIILDYCIRNGSMFAQYVFGRYILQKLYLICSRDLTKVQSHHKEHQQFQYQLIGTILTWHQMYSNVSGSTLNYTFSRLQKSGIVALYQSYKQTQSLFSANLLPANSQNLPKLPASPQPKGDIDEKQSAQFAEKTRARAMTTNPISSAIDSQSNANARPRAQSDSDLTSTTNQRVHELDAAKLVLRDGSVTLEYSEKFILEMNELISRYLKPTRQILSRQKINLADPKLSKYLQILQTVQQRLVKVISEVKNDDGVVSLAIRANDCIVDTILWFNALVKKSKQLKSKKGAVQAEKTASVSKNVMENIDLVGLEQQLLLDDANLATKKQLRDLKKEMKQQKEKEAERNKEEQETEKVEKEIEDKEKEKEAQVVKDDDMNNGNVPQQVQVAQQAADFDLISGDNVEDKAGDKVIDAANATEEVQQIDEEENVVNNDESVVNVEVNVKDESDKEEEIIVSVEDGDKEVVNVEDVSVQQVEINEEDNNNGNDNEQEDETQELELNPQKQGDDDNNDDDNIDDAAAGN